MFICNSMESKSKACSKIYGKVRIQSNLAAENKAAWINTGLEIIDEPRFLFDVYCPLPFHFVCVFIRYYS